MAHYGKMGGDPPPVIPEHEPFPDDEPQHAPEVEPAPVRKIPSPEPNPSVPDPEGIPVVNMSPFDETF